MNRLGSVREGATWVTKACRAGILLTSIVCCSVPCAGREAWKVEFDDGRVVVSTNAVYSSPEIDVRMERCRKGGRIELRGSVAVRGTNAVVSFEFPSRLTFSADEVSRFVMPMSGKMGPGLALQKRWFMPSENDMAPCRKIEHGPSGWMSMRLPPVGKRTGPRALEKIDLPDAKGALWLVRGSDRNSIGKVRRDILSFIRDAVKGQGKRIAVIGGAGSYTPQFTPVAAVQQIRSCAPKSSVRILESPSAIQAALKDGSCEMILNPFGEALPVASDDDFFPTLQRVRKWIDAGGIWIESGGGYPFYRAMVPVALREMRVSYPNANADFMRLERADGSSLTVFGVQPRPPHEPWKAPSTFVPGELSVGVDGSAAWLSHAFKVFVRPGEKRTTPTLRMIEGGSFEGDLSEYAIANDLAGRLEDKISPEKLAVLKYAPLIAVSGRYADMRAAIELFPSPMLVRLYSYLHGGFDRQYPDHLPPNEKNFGTAAELRELIDFLRAKGHLSSPYTNPTFWCEDPRGPTFAAAGEAPLAVGRDGTHYKERYGRPWGWTVSPWHAAAREANLRTRHAFRSEYPVDILFEDQSGARRSKLDFNQASPAPDCYIEGLLSSSEEGARICPLGTEDGWDRMLNIHLMGEGMSWQLFQAGPSRQERLLLGEMIARAQWTIEPLTQRLFHDRTVLKHHDNGQFVTDPKSLAWTLALGYHLNARTLNGDRLRNFTKRPDALSNVRIVSRLQHEVASAYFGKRLVSFVHRRPPIVDVEDDGVVEAVYDGGVRLKVNLSPVPREGLDAWGWVMSDGRTSRRSSDYPFDTDKERNMK